MRPAAAAGTALASLLVGLVFGWLLASGGSDSLDSVVTPPLELETELHRARETRDVLRARVEELEQQLAEVAPPPPPPPGALGGEAPQAATAEPTRPEPEAAANPGAPGFDEAALEALGFHPSDVERIRRAWEAYELERLYLVNEQARSKQRDGHHWMAMRTLEKRTAAELGEADYDALLYATGARNRVSVASVFPESPAEEAGFAEGDQITAYGDVPVYRPQDLKFGTTHCELGTSVGVTVLNDGRERRIWAPCGPLGIQLEMISAPPRPR